MAWAYTKRQVWASSVQYACGVSSLLSLGAIPYKAHQGERSGGTSLLLSSHTEAFFLHSLALDTPMEMNINIVAPTYSSIYTVDAAVGVLSP